MRKTIFRIAKMDCPSEEQMIRMKLADLTNIKSLDFNVPLRQLTVFHTELYEPILKQLDHLNFETSLVNSIPIDNYSESSSHNNQESKLLWQVLGINLFLFVLELTSGLVSHSLGLVADSLDMLADSIVYLLALFAVGGTIARKKVVAKSAGYFQLLFAIFGLAEVFRRFFGITDVPEFQTMIIISILALLGNGLCLYLLQKSKSQEAHMQASMIFTSNDVIANIGVMVAGGLVYLTNSKTPDLIVGSVVFFLVAQGAFKILKLSK